MEPDGDDRAAVSALESSLRAETAARVALAARVAKLEATVASQSVQPIAVPATPAALSMYVTGIVGAARGLDSRNNYQIGGASNREVAMRFRASRTSAPTQVAVNQRWGTGGYSAGTGGTIRVAIQADDGTGLPDGTDLVSKTFAPGDFPAGKEDRNYLVFDTGTGTMVAGRLYHIRATNTDASPTVNWMCWNMVFQNNIAAYPATRQPAYAQDLAVLFRQAGTWYQPGTAGQTDPNTQQDTPVFDLQYADGGHDGQGYFGIVSGSQRTIDGTNMVREIVTITGGAKPVNSAGFRVMRTAGTGDLTIGVYTSGGSLLGSGTVPSATFPTVGAPPGNLFGSQWGVVTFPQVVLANGSTYYIRASAPAGTTYYTAPIQAHDLPASGNPDWSSLLLSGCTGAGQDGVGGGGDYTTDGSTWLAMYGGGAPADAQAYMANI